MSVLFQILVLGAEGTGKTLLIKRLQNIIPDNLKNTMFDTIPSTVSTVGTNLVTLMWNKKKLEFRELGGPMAPIWENYYSECNALIFVMDKSNLVQLSASCILFYDIFTSDKLPTVPILLILNKADLPLGFKSTEMLSLLRLDDLKRVEKRQIDVVVVSCASGDGIPQVIEWVQRLQMSPENIKG